MDQNWIWDNKLCLSILVILVTVVYSAVKRGLQACRQDQGCTPLNGIEILQLLRKTKLFPLAHGTLWKLYDFSHDLRIWKGQLASDLPDPLTLYGCYSKVKGSSQVVLKTLRDLQKYPEWQPKLTRVTQITQAQEAPPLHHKGKASNSLPVQHDFVSLETEDTTSQLVSTLNYLSLLLRGEPFVRKLININRYWHREDNGCCWLLEVPESAAEGWTFHLAQPVEGWFEMDQCLLTVVQAAGSSRAHQEAVRPASRLGALQNYFLYRKVQCTPLTTVTLPSAREEDEADDQEEVLPTLPVSKSADDLLLQANAKADPTPKETNILKRFRNLIEEKKEWYEERKRNKTPKLTGATSTPDVVDSGEGDTTVTSLKEGDSDSELSDCIEGDSPTDTPVDVTVQNIVSNAAPEQNQEKDPQPKPERRKSLLQFLRSSTQAEDRPPGRDGTQEESSPKGGASRSALSLNLLQRSQTFDTFPQRGNNKNGTAQGDGEVEEDSEEGKLRAVFKTMGNTVAAEIISEKFKVSNIDIGRSYDEQAQQTGGWIYCGLEKEVVILRKMLNDGAPVQSYLGKGIIAVPPKAVFEALKNPRTRFTYDEMLKKVEILHDFDGGLKIVYLYHEVSQLFRKEARDFCLLQSERIEGFKYIISMKSVGWPDCPVNEDITRGKFHSSGWIIEPANRDNKLYSMVTYIVQMELGTSKTNSGYLVEELAAKQPLSISHLRAYLTPAAAHRAASLNNANTDRRKSSPSTPMGTLAAAAAFASQGTAHVLHKSSSVDS